MMSIWENAVDYNISESGVHPMTIEELVDDPKAIEELLATGLGYPHTAGIAELRERIAALYPGAAPDNVLVTTGASQANFTSMLTLLEAGDEIVVMLPNYMQIWGIGHNFGLNVRPFWLREELQWGFDPGELAEAVTDKTRLIAICNPNNPTGRIMPPAEMDMVAAAADRVGAWILADEVYAGAERVTDEETPSFWGRYDRVLAIHSMSKAYGLPGLRIGWVVAPAETIEAIWARQDYVTIGATMLGNKLAAHALSPEVRPRVIARTREYIRRGYANFERWCGEHEGLFTWVPPEAAAIVFVRYHVEANSTELVMRLIGEQGAFVIPGDLFGLDGYLRISFGVPIDYLTEGLNRLYRVIASYG